MKIESLASVFTLDDARASGLRKDEVYDLLARGEIERVGRGVYLRPGIVDCFRLMHREGRDVAHEALRRWLRAGGARRLPLRSSAQRRG